MTTTAAILDLVSVDFLTICLSRLVRFFCEWRKVPFDDQHRRSFKMAAVVAILYLFPINYLTNTWVNWSDFLVAY
jgi:hypothetical protein